MIRIVVVLLAFTVGLNATAQAEIKSVTVTYSDTQGIGEEKGVMRRDPSDIITVGDLYYVWYSKGKIAPGYDATVWYATSPDGHKWTEKGMALDKGEAGTWEGASVFTPNILVAQGKYWLFYTGTSREFLKPFNPDSKIGIAVSDSPDGPWERIDSNPVLKNSDNPEDFDSHLVDDACLIVRDGKYWFYYKGRQMGKSPGQTQMGLAIADKPEGPYVRHENNPVIPGNHEVLVWPQGKGVAAMIGTTGPKEITRSLVYSEDGLNFTKTHTVIDVPHAAGAYRPEAFTQSGKGQRIEWGVHIGRKRGALPFIQRFDIKQENAGGRKLDVEDSSAANGTGRAKPNFVIIFTDDQGYQDVGCFGSPDIRTPRLDAMARQGMRFTSFYAQPICGPSRAALMTGCYPMRVAERGHTKQVHPILHEDEITIAEVLKSKGYATACFGKWDLAKHAQTGFFMDLFPTRQGFDYFYGTPTSNDRVVNLYRNEELIEPSSDMATLTQRYTDEAIAFIKKNRKQPFFVYIPHTMPHTRLDASAKFKGKSKRGLYGDVIEEIDFNVGRILDALSELDLAHNTYVLFTSDNGPWLIKNKNHADGHLVSDHGGSAGPLRSGKVSTFEGGVRAPTILWGPGRVPAGTTCGSIATTMDVMPTFAALAGAEVPSDRVIDGEDIRHLFHGEFDKADPDKAYFYYLRVHLQAVRQGNWKLHLPRDKEPIGAAPFSRNTHIAPADRVGFDEPFLVDLKNDLGETTNVAAENPQVVKRLLGLADAMRDDLGDYNRVGKNMRFFDPLNSRPTTPPVPAPRKPVRRK